MEKSEKKPNTMNHKHLLRTTAVLAVLGIHAGFGQDLEPDIEAETLDREAGSFQVTADYFLAMSDAEAPVEDGLVNTVSGDNDADLVGTTLSYGFNTRLFLDFSYLRGDSEFEYVTTSPGTPGMELVNRPNSDQEWMELRLRYTPDFMVGRTIQGYLSGGLTLIQSDDETRSTAMMNGQLAMNPTTGEPLLEDALIIDGESENLFANVGAGIGMAKPMNKWVIGFKAEANLLYGNFDTENRQLNPVTGDFEAAAGTDESIWGVIARGSGFVLVPLTADRKVNLSVEGGMRYYYWDLDAGSQKVYGPFGKVGVSFRF